MKGLTGKKGKEQIQSVGHYSLDTDQRPTGPRAHPLLIMYLATSF